MRAPGRLTAVTAGYTGDAATARRLLGDDDPTVRASALAALHRLDELLIGDLRDGLDDPDPLVRRRALLVAAAAPRRWADELSLHAVLGSADAETVETAAWCAGEFERVDDATLDLLHTIATDHAAALCRESAAAALGAIGDPRSLGIVLAACDDVATVRRRAVLALAAFDDPAADAKLTTLLEDRDWQVRQAAEDLLGEH